jgi:hypothetical protein
VEARKLYKIGQQLTKGNFLLLLINSIRRIAPQTSNNFKIEKIKRI